jgi:hypothetical protein
MTAEQAEEIYVCKLALLKGRNGSPERGQSLHVSRIFQVSPKAVRDIWNHRTWKIATQHLWRSIAPFRNGAFHSNSTPVNSEHSNDNREVCLCLITEIIELEVAQFPPRNLMLNLWHNCQENHHDVAPNSSQSPATSAHHVSNNFNISIQPMAQEFWRESMICPNTNIFIVDHNLPINLFEGQQSDSYEWLTTCDDPFHHDWPHWQSSDF